MERERQVWAKIRQALDTTACKPKNVFTAREALERAREALETAAEYFREKDCK